MILRSTQTVGIFPNSILNWSGSNELDFPSKHCTHCLEFLKWPCYHLVSCSYWNICPIHRGILTIHWKHILRVYKNTCTSVWTSNETEQRCCVIYSAEAKFSQYLCSDLMFLFIMPVPSLTRTLKASILLASWLFNNVIILTEVTKLWLWLPWIRTRWQLRLLRCLELGKHWPKKTLSQLHSIIFVAVCHSCCYTMYFPFIFLQDGPNRLGWPTGMRNVMPLSLLHPGPDHSDVVICSYDENVPAMRLWYYFHSTA